MSATSPVFGDYDTTHHGLTLPNTRSPRFDGGDAA